MAKTPDPERLEILQGTLDMLILRTLQWGPCHGHGIGQAISQQSDDLLKIETGSLYPALHRLEKRGWVRAEWAASDTGRDARFYTLTRTGRKQLEEQSENWDRLSGAISTILRTAE
jgi:PadR family transcriptional regulator PadR